MFARFNENPAMTLQDIKETKRYGRTDTLTDGRTHGQLENSIPPTNKVCGGYNNVISDKAIDVITKWAIQLDWFINVMSGKAVDVITEG